MRQTTYAFIESAGQASTVDELTRLFDRAVTQFGFPNMVVGALTRPEKYGADSALIATTFPTSWVDHYFRSGYDKNDPVSKAVLGSSLPVRWSSVAPDNGRQRAILAEASEAGLKDGIAIPVHGPNGDVFCVSLAGEDRDSVDQAPLDELRLITVQLQSTLLGIVNLPETSPEKPNLSAREADCLSYCAAGKTSWEIGQILGISEKTVDFHMGNAMIKLGANSRILAVVKALRQGLIIA